MSINRMGRLQPDRRALGVARGSPAAHVLDQKKLAAVTALAVDFCGPRLAIGAASERVRALTTPAGTRVQALQTRANSRGVAPASRKAAYRALLERAGSRQTADRGGVDGVGARDIRHRLARGEAL